MLRRIWNIKFGNTYSGGDIDKGYKDDNKFNSKPKGIWIRISFNILRCCR